jgi:hypothetical protein
LLAFLFISVIYIQSLVNFFPEQINSLPAWLQFLIIAVPALLAPSLILWKISKDGLKKFVGAILLLMASDIALPDYLVRTTGELNNATLFHGASVDYFFGSLLQAIGLRGFIVYFLVYFVIAIVFVLAGLYLLSDKEVKANIP